MKNSFLLIFVLSFLALSCRYIGGKPVRGNGNWKTEERSVGSFHSVEVNGSMDVLVAQGDFQPVRIEADENLMRYIEVFLEGDRLVVQNKMGYNLHPTRKMKVLVTAPSYSKIDVSGACNILGQGKINNPEDLGLEVSGAGDIKMDINAPRLDVEVSGSGSVDLKGETRDFSVSLSGAGKVRCFDLKSENTKLDISGAGDAQIYASMSIDADVSGAGSVQYKGSPQKVDQHVSGAGSVRKVD